MEKLIRQREEFIKQYEQMKKESSALTNVSTTMFVNPLTNIAMVASGMINSEILHLAAQPPAKEKPKPSKTTTKRV